MKLFWSWQADTPGPVARFFVRDTLLEAIDALRADKDLVEPIEREARDALHLDSDRQGVPGSPDLAATIFGKIEQSAVFVADVTLVGATGGARSSSIAMSPLNMATRITHSATNLS
ncbi:hypothetical protein [Bradyrhizobium vignae]|uniref:Uncharacterized protein n=1 Tax=Bradyrhizobium vignae TaxID=1549949 RepID=A0A2U3Q8T4_9BRAD|nr:hypothetical protein [Bradyrhizobium vignae]SPP97824.1 protein of unknown function [Bradyrhizobium vignae]